MLAATGFLIPLCAPLSLPRHDLDMREAEEGIGIAAPGAPRGGDALEVRARCEAVLQRPVCEAGLQDPLGEHLRPIPGCAFVAIGLGGRRDARLAEARFAEPSA